jgi:hypothetical protein
MGVCSLDRMAVRWRRGFVAGKSRVRSTLTRRSDLKRDVVILCILADLRFPSIS